MATGVDVGCVTDVSGFFIVSVTSPRDGECKNLRNVGNMAYSYKKDPHEIYVPRNSIERLD